VSRTEGISRALLWVVASCALLFAGFGAVVLGLYWLGIATGSFRADTAHLIAATTYFRVVFVKGLLPQLVVALALWPLLRRLLPGVERNTARVAAGLALVGLLAYAVVAPLLLTAHLPGWPALQMKSTYHHVGTATLSVAAVVAAGLAGRWVAYRRRARAVPPT
jgi:hypothetical protein